jgi:hypothetical protein
MWKEVESVLIEPFQEGEVVAVVLHQGHESNLRIKV